MKWLAGVSLFLLSHGIAAAQEKAKQKNLVVHEWGIFRVHEDEAMANADVRAIWDGLPPFIYGHVRGRLVPQHWGAIEVRNRPIIFFHATEPMQFGLTLGFPGGKPGVWYPATIYPSILLNAKQPPPTDNLQWELAVQKIPDGWQPKPVQEAEKGHWFNRLREVKADDLFARFGPGGHYVERDKLIYYDGLFPQRKWVKIDVEKDGVTLTNRVKHPVFDVTVVDRREDGKPRIARIEKLAEEEKAKVEFKAIDDSRFASEASDEMRKQLAATGLYKDEAESMVDLSRQEFFETPGLHAFYRIPQDEYDRLLPLKITGVPHTTVRTGLVFHTHLETDLAERVMELVRQLDSPRFAVRDGARKKLLQIGPAAMVHLAKIKPADLSAEAWRQVEALVKNWNAKEAFE